MKYTFEVVRMVMKLDDVYDAAVFDHFKKEFIRFEVDWDLNFVRFYDETNEPVLIPRLEETVKAYMRKKRKNEKRR